MIDIRVPAALRSRSALAPAPTAEKSLPGDWRRPAANAPEERTRARSPCRWPAQSLAPGWWVGEAALEPDELRADDRRPVRLARGAAPREPWRHHVLDLSSRQRSPCSSGQAHHRWPRHRDQRRRPPEQSPCDRAAARRSGARRAGKSGFGVAGRALALGSVEHSRRAYLIRARGTQRSGGRAALPYRGRGQRRCGEPVMCSRRSMENPGS